MIKDLEGLEIYKKYTDLYYYEYMIIEKFPKFERDGLCFDIRNTTYKGLEEIIKAEKTYNKTERLKHLNNLDVHMKILKMLVRISYKKKYINSKNYKSWSIKITNVTNLLGGWIKSCLKQ